jgi:hypothetical protein
VDIRHNAKIGREKPLSGKQREHRA